MKNIVFDFDGVIADTNKLKSNAFSYIFSSLNLPFLNEFLAYHKKNGGISAKKKFHHYINEINANSTYDSKFLEEKFRFIVKENINKQRYDPFFDTFKISKDLKFHIISGGNKKEIENFLKYKNIDNFFHGGLILGGENSKKRNFEILLNEYHIKPYCYLGDSFNDFKTSNFFGINFYFISQWSESSDWLVWTKENNIKVYDDLSDFFNY